MTLSQSELEAVAGELNSSLAGATFADISTLDPVTAILRFVKLANELRVLVSIKPRCSRIHLTSRPALPCGPGFARTATHLLAGFTVEQVRTRYNDRVVVIEMKKGDVRRTLLFECSGHHPNLFVLDSRGIILTMLTPSRSHLRDLRPSRPYAKPLHHESDKIAAIRFLDGEGGISARIEAAYDEIETRERLKEKAADVRAVIRRAIEHDERLIKAIEGDIERAQMSAQRLDQRALRLTAAVSNATRRLETIRTRLEELRKVMASLVSPTEEAIVAAAEVARRLKPPRRQHPRSNLKRRT